MRIFHQDQVLVKTNMYVITMVRRATTAIFHFSPLVPRLLRLSSAGVPNSLLPDDIHYVETLGIIHDPLGQFTPVWFMRLVHKVQRSPFAMLTRLVCITPHGMDKSWKLGQYFFAGINHVWFASSGREIDWWVCVVNTALDVRRARTSAGYEGTAGTRVARLRAAKTTALFCFAGFHNTALDIRWVLGA